MATERGVVRRIEIDPVTRIEGHAKITLHLGEDGRVQDARFHVTQFRGFEKIAIGRPFYEMPGLMARTCGICPVSHLIAGAKAGDALLAVEVPEAAVRLRRILHLAQIFQSHALSFFYLSAPDLLLGMDADPAKRNVLGLFAEYPQVVRGGVALRKFGQEIIDALVSVRDECDRIDREALRIWAKADRLRIVPEAVDRTNPDVGGFALPTAELNRSIGSSFLKRDIPLQSILDAMHLKAATHFGLTIPVSEIFAALLKNDSDLRKNTGWLHAPAGLHLMNRARSEPKLEPFFQPGSLAHVAVSHVLDRLASHRERDKTLESRGIILMWGMATLLAFFTNGATLYAAAIVQAAFSANEIYDSVVEYQQDAALAAVSLAAIEEAGWRRPSTINLVRLIVADASDIVQGTIGIKGLPLVLDLWLGAFALIHPDDTPSRR